MPLMTSSLISSTPNSSQIWRMRWEYPALGESAASDAPTTGSAMKAATVSGPSRSSRARRRSASASPLKLVSGLDSLGQALSFISGV